MSRRVVGILVAVILVTACAASAAGFDKELYPGESELYGLAKKEGVVVSYDTGPTWANWAGQFEAFQKRYGIEISYNDLGSGATVVRLDKERMRPQADTAYYFMPFGAMAGDKGLTQPFKPGVEYIAALQKAGNVRMIEKTTEYDKFVKGEVPDERGRPEDIHRGVRL